MTDQELYLQYQKESGKQPEAQPGDAELYKQYQDSLAQTPKEQKISPLEAGTSTTLNALYGGYLPQFVGAGQALYESGKKALHGDISGAISGFTPEYIKERDIQAQQLQQAKEQYPYGAMAGEIAGGTGLVLATGGMGLVGEAAPAATAMGRIGQAAKAGASYGLLQNPGETPGQISPIQAPERIMGSAAGGIIGGAVHGGLESIGLGGAKKEIANKVEQAFTEQSPTYEASSLGSGYQAKPDIQQISSRPTVQAEMSKLQGIAFRQGLPEPTIAQATQGKSILAEKNLMDVPLYGKKIREQADAQVAAVRKNLENEVGDFVNAPTHPQVIGEMTKNLGDTNVQIQKQLATNLYDKVDELGANATTGKRTFFNKYRDFAGEQGLINPDLSRAKYAADTGLTRSEFDTLQNAIFDGMDAIKKSASPTIPFNSINALKKTLASTVEDNIIKDSNGVETYTNTARILNRFVKDLDGSIQSSLNREHPELGATFREANKRYAEFKDTQGIANKLFGDKVSPEDVMKKVMSNTNNIESMKKVVGEDKMREIGMAHANDILSNILPKSGEGRADSAINALKKIRPELESSIGEKSYNNIMDNLYYLNKTKEPLVISRESASHLWALAGGVGKVAGATADIVSNIQKSGRGFNLPILPQVSQKYAGPLRSVITPNVSGKIGQQLGTAVTGNGQ
jgi:hypothetical protein